MSARRDASADASEEETEGTPAEAEREATAHLEGTPDGCGCVEMWEATSEHREG